MFVCTASIGVDGRRDEYGIGLGIGLALLAIIDYYRRGLNWLNIS